LLALLDHEVPGPRVPGPMPVPPAGSYSPVTSRKTAVDRVKNYSSEQLAELVPSLQVMQLGNAQRTITTSEGMTQESYIVLPHCDEDNIEMDDEDHLDDNLFESSLLHDDLPSFEAMASARDSLKPHMSEVLECLDALKSEESIEEARKVLNDLANKLRLDLATSSGRKRNIDNCRTVNMNVEEDLCKRGRSHASKNC
jgi:hypothetical protein